MTAGQKKLPMLSGRDADVIRQAAVTGIGSSVVLWQAWLSDVALGPTVRTFRIGERRGSEQA